MEACTQQGTESENLTIIIDNAPAHSILETICEEFPHVRILQLVHYFFLFFLLIKPNRAYVERIQEQCQTKLQERMPDSKDSKIED